jgi:hypothetical protein
VSRVSRAIALKPIALSRALTHCSPVSATKHHSRNNATRFTLLKRLAEQDGIPYSSCRDAHFRNELLVLKIGRNEKYQRWYVARTDWEKWLESRKETGAA